MLRSLLQRLRVVDCNRTPLSNHSCSDTETTTLHHLQISNCNEVQRSFVVHNNNHCNTTNNMFSRNNTRVSISSLIHIYQQMKQVNLDVTLWKCMPSPQQCHSRRYLGLLASYSVTIRSVVSGHPL